MSANPFMPQMIDVQAAGGLVPMVEPEVLMDGDHDIGTCYEVTEVVLRSLFDALYNQSVMLEGTILKASMVVPGKACDEQASVEEVAESTLMCLKSAVPAILPGIVFLSGGQNDHDATAHLDAMNKMGPRHGRQLRQGTGDGVRTRQGQWLGCIGTVAGLIASRHRREIERQPSAGVRLCGEA